MKKGKRRTPKCENHNCVLQPNHEGWHTMYAYGTKRIGIEWMDGEYRIPGGVTGTYPVTVAS